VKNNNHSLGQSYDQLLSSFDEESGIMWCYANPSPRPCFTPQLLRDLHRFLNNIRARCINESNAGIFPEVKYLILGSYKPGIFSLGGDLALFVAAIKNKDKVQLTEYMRLSIDVLYATHTNLNAPLTTIALIRGNALGAGFEGALACDYIIAEEGVQLGFPEVLFNMFPGMGAYSFLSRKINQLVVEKMILGGRVYKSEELHEMGIIDLVAKKGRGVEEVREFIKQLEKNGNTRRSLLKVRNRVSPVTYQELIDIGEIWVEAALSLTARELKIMERFIRSQDKMAKSLVDTVELRETVNS
jgi:DSF synthase